MHRIAAFARGERVPARIYVLLAAMPLPPGMAARRQTLDGVTVVPPASADEATRRRAARWRRHDP